MPGCTNEALDFIEAQGILPLSVPLGDLPSQQLYSCETYQLLGVELITNNSAMVATGSEPTFSLTSNMEFSVNDAATPATLSLTGCNPYSCSLYTNMFFVYATSSVTLTVGPGPGNQDMIDVVFGELGHNAQPALVPNTLITGCSVGNLNEDLQANGVDIFNVLVNDLNPQIGVAMQLHLYDVEVATEAASILCLQGL